MGLWSASLWFVKGYRNYTKQGFERASKNFRKEDLENINMARRKIMVTGANSGLGFETCRILASKGADVIMLCRNKERGEEALQKILASNPTGKVSLFVVDISLLSSIDSFLNEFKDSVDVIINNAGALSNNGMDVTAEGLEQTLATHVVGMFYFTEKMIPKMNKSGRVIVVTSAGMLTEKLDLSNMQKFVGLKEEDKSTIKFDGVAAYAQCKRQQTEIVNYWAEKFKDDRDLKFFSTHPGWTDTPGVSTSLPSFYKAMKNSLRTGEQGCDSMVWLACVDKERLPENGSLVEDRKATEQHLWGGGTQTSLQMKEDLVKSVQSVIDSIKNKK